MEKLILLFAFILLIFGCAKKTDSISLTNQVWSLSSYGFLESTKSKPIEGSRYILSFSDNSNLVSGELDCNNYGSEYGIDNENKLDISEGTSTKMKCVNAGKDGYAEELVFISSAISGSHTYIIEGNELKLTSDDSSQLIFVGVFK